MPSKFPAHILKLSADVQAAIDEHNAERDFESLTETEDQRQATNALKSKAAQAIRTAYLKGKAGL